MFARINHRHRFPILAASAVAVLSWQLARAGRPDYPIRPVSFEHVELDDTFWRPRLEVNRKVTVPICFARCEETGRIRNFDAAAEKDASMFRGIRFDDSDVFKVIEGAAYTLTIRDDPKLQRYLDRLIAKIAAAQEEDGYLYTVKTSGADDPYGKAPRWSRLDHSHELYNIGHLYEAAVAHFRATGKRTLLDVAIRSADLVVREFGPAPGQRKDVPGHEEIEIGLVKLYRVTGDSRYLKLARFFVDQRGRETGRKRLYGTYAQDHRPIHQQREAVGHAVRGGYYYAAVADIAALTGDRSYVEAINRIWQDVVEKKMYLTGSVGQHGAGEGYAGAYKLSNRMAYNETCASIALVLWNHRMFLLHGESKYIDVLERTLYNGVLAGVAMSGDRFFYPNPLECDMVFPFNHGSFERSPWFGTSCCPTNIVRTIPSVPGYVYAVTDDSLYVNLYIAGQSDIRLGAHTIGIRQDTRYPWEGKVVLSLQMEKPADFALRLRIPGWARGQVLPSSLYSYLKAEPTPWRISVNGQDTRPRTVDGYAVIRRRWQPGDRVELDIPMRARRVVAREEVLPDRGRVAVERGPLVYCIEGADHRRGVHNRWLPDSATLRTEQRSDWLGGVTLVVTEGGELYRTDDGQVATKDSPLTMIPYYTWCHRGANPMRVWLPRTRELADPPRVPTIASRATPKASHCWSADTVSALHDQMKPKNSNDHEIPRFTWWDHRGGREWVEYHFAEKATVASVSVYWFDDTGRGQCRLPRSWQLFYRQGDSWIPVKVRKVDPIAADRFNHMEFEPVRTDGLRMVVQLREGFSGGILEWEVGTPGASDGP